MRFKTAGERLAWARERADFKSARAFSTARGFTVSGYNAHERAGQDGGRMFDEETAKTYARHLKVNWVWLLTGEGLPDVKDAPQTAERVPVISWVSAGAMASPDFQDGEELGAAWVSGLPKGDWFALKVEGDSMDRISPPGSVIVVNRRDKALVNNACYIIADSETGEATYKRFRSNPPRWEPVSVNPAREPLFPDNDPVIIGRVKRSILEM